MDVHALAATLATVASGAGKGWDPAVHGPLGLIFIASMTSAAVIYRDQRQQIRDLTTANTVLQGEKDAILRDLMRDVIPVMTQTVQVMSDVHDELPRRGPRNGR